MTIMNVWQDWQNGGTKEEKIKNFIEAITWKAVDNQYIMYACNVIAQEAFN